MKNEMLVSGDFVECINRTEENHENLQLGKVYEVVGANIIDGNMIYAVQDEAGNLYYSMNRFKKVGHISTGTVTQAIKTELTKISKNSTYGRFGDKPKSEDMVNNPSHYTSGGIETIDYLEAKLGEEGFIAYLQGNILKYMSRAGKKHDTVEDFKKAQWYLNKLLSVVDKNPKPVQDTATHRPVTHKQRIYVASLTTKLDLDRLNLPEYLSPKKDYHDLSEAECAVLIGKLVSIRDYLEEVDC